VQWKEFFAATRENLFHETGVCGWREKRIRGTRNR